MPARIGRQHPRPRRLLIVTSLYPTPDRPEAGAFVARRVAILRESGAEVVVAAASTYRRRGLLRYLEVARKALLARGPFDGVECHVLLPAGPIGLVAAFVRRRPLVVYAHGWDVNGWAWESPLHTFLARLVARRAAAVVTNSAATAESVARLGATARVVSPGVDFEEFRPSEERRDEIRRRLGLPDGLVALYVGALVARKGADVFAAAIETVPEWHGVVVGEGELAGTIDGRSPNLERRPPVPPQEVSDYLRAADVVVVPSRQEPLGLAAIEALACATPIVAARVGGLAGVVVDGVNGIAVPPDDPGAIAAALRELEDPALRTRLSAAARASVAGHDIRAASAEMARVWSEVGVTI